MLKTLRTAKDYSGYQMTYGLIPLLIVLDYFERHENYEECAEIVKGIQYLNDLVGKEGCTKLTEQAIIEHHEIQSNYTQKPITLERYKQIQHHYGTMIFEEVHKFKSLKEELHKLR